VRPPRLRRLFAQGKTALGLWITLEAPSVAEIAATMGLDWVVIDAEHGQLDFREVLEHLRAVRGSQTTALVRVQEIEQGTIKRVLDLGAEGIVVPMVRNAAEVAQAVRFAKYPPQGVRGIGAERATKWGKGIAAYTRDANRQTLVVPIIECAEAADHFESILAVRGVDAFFFGPADLAASMGHLGQWGHPEVMKSILRMRKQAASRGIPSGILAMSPREAMLRVRQGFRMIALGIDALLMIRSLEEMLSALRRPVPPSAWEE
jgi:2-keto-3-deoxy-L-rhamnonate aldolase RhmA